MATGSTPVSDTDDATTVESEILAQTSADTDPRNVTESQALVVALAVSETATVGESAAISVSDSDDANVSESEALSAALTNADDAGGTDSEALGVAITQTDSATVVDSASVDQGGTAKSDTDDATVTEAEALTETSGDTDPRNVTEAQTLGVVLAQTDPATVVESQSLAAALTDTDPKNVTETQTVNVSVSDTDAATVVDSASVDQGGTNKTGSDAAGVTESAVVTVSLADTDPKNTGDTATLAVAIAQTDPKNTTESERLGLADTDPATVTESSSLAATSADTDDANVVDTGSVGGVPYFRGIGTMATGDTTTLVVSPPAGIQTGDLLVLIGHARTNEDFSVISAGGQTWELRDGLNNSTSVLLKVWTAQATGTVSNVTLGTLATAGLTFSGVMLAYSTVDGPSPIDVDLSLTAFSSPTTPFDITLAAVNTQSANAIAIAIFGSRDNNTWAVQTAGWNERLAGAAGDNTLGLDNSIHVVDRQIASPGTTGSVTSRQTLVGGDGGVGGILVLRTAASTTAVSGSDQANVTENAVIVVTLTAGDTSQRSESQALVAALAQVDPGLVVDGASVQGASFTYTAGDVMPVYD